MDAHDTNLPLNQGELEEEKKTVTPKERCCPLGKAGTGKPALTTGVPPKHTTGGNLL